jgi:hypothetical protein
MPKPPAKEHSKFSEIEMELAGRGTKYFKMAPLPKFELTEALPTKRRVMYERMNKALL